MTDSKLSFGNISANLFVYGLLHALVDFTCAGLLFTLFKDKLVTGVDFVALILLYNVLTFGLQSVLGLVTDYFKSPRLVACIGALTTAIAVLIFFVFPVLAVVLAGVGNAMFHIGGGSIALNLTPGKTSAPGVFVAPGAFGLFLGTFLGKLGQFIPAIAFFLLVFLSFFIFVVKKPKMNYEQEPLKYSISELFWAIFLCLFFVVMVRSFIGFSLAFPWKSHFDLLVLLTLAVVFGKAFGGIIADKFGWIRVGVGSLLLSIPFLYFGINYPSLGMIGMFLFNITMPITLVALSNILPGRPGFAFGLTCLALLFGAFPTLFHTDILPNIPGIIYGVILVSALGLYLGLYKLKK